MPVPEVNVMRMLCGRIEDRTGIAARAFGFARQIGFEHRACWEIGIAVQELVSNLVRHGGGGHLELRASLGMLEVIAVDRGPGIPAPVLQSQASWTRGLGAVKRLMHEIEIGSADTEPGSGLGRGTRIRARRYVERNR